MVVSISYSQMSDSDLLLVVDGNKHVYRNPTADDDRDTVWVDLSFGRYYLNRHYECSGSEVADQIRYAAQELVRRGLIKNTVQVEWIKEKTFKYSNSYALNLDVKVAGSVTVKEIRQVLWQFSKKYPNNINYPQSYESLDKTQVFSMGQVPKRGKYVKLGETEEGKIVDNLAMAIAEEIKTAIESLVN